MTTTSEPTTVQRSGVFPTPRPHTVAEVQALLVAHGYAERARFRCDEFVPDADQVRLRVFEDMLT